MFYYYKTLLEIFKLNENVFEIYNYLSKLLKIN